MQISKNSFFPDAISSWNNIISDFNAMPTFDHLKNHIFKLVRPSERSIYGIHDPKGVKYLFQLRVGLSPLKYHKWKHNFIDIFTEICTCNTDVENTKHYLLDCPLFAIQRISLMTQVRSILQKNNLRNKENDPNLYLYGDSSFNIYDNKKILLSTIKYLKETKRFE